MEIEECLSLMLKELTPKTKKVTVPILQAAGKICAEDVTVKSPVPPFPKSAMDGYAVAAKDLEGTDKNHPFTAKVIGELCAGDYKQLSYQKNTAVRIMTGAYVPDGYDAVIRQEDTDYGMDEVTIFSAVTPYQNYCRIGEDMMPGDVVCQKGTVLKPVHIGLLASMGIADVLVTEPLKTAVISTGSELLQVGEKPEPGKIYNSISYILETTLTREGVEVVENVICKDEKNLLMETIAEALKKADVVITTGGVSVGKKDLVPDALSALGAKQIFDRANIQPGTPTKGFVLENRPILCLSGNPYAALANFAFYFWSMAACLMQQKSYEPLVTTAIFQGEYPKKNKCRRFIRAYAENGFVTLPSEVHSASVIANMTACNCMIDLPQGKSMAAGDMVKIRYLK